MTQPSKVLAVIIIEFFIFFLNFQSEECAGCQLWTLGTDIKNGDTFKVNATFPQRFQVVKSDNKKKGTGTAVAFLTFDNLALET